MNIKTKIIIIASIVLILIITAYLILVSRRGDPNNNELTPTPTLNTTNDLTSIETDIPEVVTSPEPFTGVLEEELTPDDVKKIDQERDLRNSSPYDGISFVVSYSYIDYIFDVSLGTPREKALEQFQSWRELVYPEIPEDQFRFVN